MDAGADAGIPIFIIWISHYSSHLSYSYSIKGKKTFTLQVYFVFFFGKKKSRTFFYSVHTEVTCSFEYLEIALFFYKELLIFRTGKKELWRVLELTTSSDDILVLMLYKMILCQKPFKTVLFPCVTFEQNHLLSKKNM